MCFHTFCFLSAPGEWGDIDGEVFTVRIMVSVLTNDWNLVLLAQQDFLSCEYGILLLMVIIIYLERTSGWQIHKFEGNNSFELYIGLRHPGSGTVADFDVKPQEQNLRNPATQLHATPSVRKFPSPPRSENGLSAVHQNETWRTRATTSALPGRPAGGGLPRHAISWSDILCALFACERPATRHKPDHKGFFSPKLHTQDFQKKVKSRKTASKRGAKTGSLLRMRVSLHTVQWKPTWPDINSKLCAVRVLSGTAKKMFPSGTFHYHTKITTTVPGCDASKRVFVQVV